MALPTAVFPARAAVVGSDLYSFSLQDKLVGITQGAVTSASTSVALDVTSLALFPTVGGIAVLSNQKFTYTSISAGALQGVAWSSPGWSGTIAAGGVVQLGYFSQHNDRLVAEVAAIESALTGGSALLHGLTIKPALSETALTLDLQDQVGAIGTKFISFQVAGVEKGYANWDSVNGEIDFVNTSLAIGGGSKLIMENDRPIQFGDPSQTTMKYSSTSLFTEVAGTSISFTNAIRFASAAGATPDISLARQAASVLETTGSLAGGVRWGMSGANAPFIDLRLVSTDAQPAARLLSDRISFGPGGASGPDAVLFRQAVGVLAIPTDQYLGLGTTGQSLLGYSSTLGIVQGTGTDWNIQKFGGRVNVKAFGAKGDGVTDDTAAITAAVSALTSGFAVPAGGEIFFPPGTFMFSAEVLLTGWGYVVVGSGAYTTILKALAGFTGTALLRWVGDGGTFPLDRAVGIRDLQVDMNNQAAHGLFMLKPYDHVVVRNVRVLNVNDSKSAWRIEKASTDTSNAQVGQTVLVENSIFTHKNDATPTAPTVYWQRVQEAVINGSKSWGGVTTATTTPAVPWHFDDCRGIVMVGCSSVGSSTAGILVTATERNVTGIDIIGHTFEGLGPMIVTQVTGSFTISQLNLKEPRIEGTVGGIVLSGVQYGTLEARSQTVTIDALCGSPRIYTNDLTLVTDNGPRTSIAQYENSSSKLNAFYPRLSITSSNSPELRYETLGRTNFWKLFWSASAVSDFSFALRHYSDQNTFTSIMTWTHTGETQNLQDFVVVPQTSTVTDGAIVNSPDMVLRALYDSDITGGITVSTRNASFRHVMLAGGASPSSELQLLLGGTTRFTFGDLGTFKIKNQGSSNDPVLSSNNASKVFLVQNGFEILNTSTGANPLITSASSGQALTIAGNINPSADATWSIGNPTNRYSAMSINQISFYAASGDSVPTVRLTTSGYFAGAGGAAGLDVAWKRQAASVMELTDQSGALAGSARLGLLATGNATVAVRSAASSANPNYRMSSANGFEFGTGGASATDAFLKWQAASSVELTGSFAGSLRFGMTGAATPRVSLRAAAADANALSHLTGTNLSFGPGGASALDTQLAYQAVTTLELTDPRGTNTGSVRYGVSAAGTPFFEHRIAAADAQPAAQLLKDRLNFGPGGASATDVSIQRTGAGTLTITGATTIAGDVLPDTDNSRKVGSASLRYVTVNSIAFNVYNALGDANVLYAVGTSGLIGGAGAGNATDFTLARNASSDLKLTGALAGDVRLGMTGAATPRVSLRLATADANHVAALLKDRVEFGAGGASAVDVDFRRTAANTAQITASTSLTYAGQLLLTTTGSAGGVVIGGDASLYRQAASVLELTGAVAGSIRYGLSGAATPFEEFRLAQADAQPAMQILKDRIAFGPGGASALDYSLIRTGANTGTLSGTLSASVDNTYDLGTALLRWRALYLTPTSLHVLAAASDANDVTTIGNALLKFGAGGGTATDIQFARQAASVVELTGSLAGSVRYGMSGAGTPFVALRAAAADANPTAQLLNASLAFGPGGATAVRTYLFEQAAQVLAASSDGATIDGAFYARTLKVKNQGSGGDPTLIANGSATGWRSTGSFFPDSDAALNLGLGTLRWATAAFSGSVQWFAASGDANSTLSINGSSSLGIQFGAGGANARDVRIVRLSGTPTTVELDDPSGTRVGSVRWGLSATNSPFLALRNAAADANAIASLLTDRLNFGPGGASAVDVDVRRTGANALQLTASSGITHTGDIVPSADNTLNVGTATIRLANVNVSTRFAIFGASGDANPVFRVTSTNLAWGAGGASAVDVILTRQAASVIEHTGAVAGSIRFGMSGAALPFLALRAAAADANALVSLTSTGLNIGPGGASAVDVTMLRTGANAVTITATSGITHAGSLLLDANNTRDIGVAGTGLRSLYFGTTAPTAANTGQVGFANGGLQVADGTVVQTLLQLDGNSPTEFTLTNNTNRTPSTTRPVFVTVVADYNTLTAATTVTATVTVGSMTFTLTPRIRNFDAVSGQRLTQVVYAGMIPPNTAYKVNMSTAATTLTAWEQVL